MCKTGSPDYSNGLNNYLNQKRSAAVPQKLSNPGMGKIVPFCELSDRPQADSQRTESLHCMASVTTLLPLTTSPTCLRKWLGDSTEPLSGCDRMIITIILHLRTALRSGGFFVMAAAILLVSGMLTSKDLPKALPSENLRRAEQSLKSQGFPF